MATIIPSARYTSMTDGGYHRVLIGRGRRGLEKS